MPPVRDGVVGLFCLHLLCEPASGGEGIAVQVISTFSRATLVIAVDDGADRSMSLGPYSAGGYSRERVFFTDTDDSPAHVLVRRAPSRHSANSDALPAMATS